MSRITRTRPKMAPRFARASGAPISDEDAQIIGEELLRIAEAHKVDGIRSLDKHLVFAEVENDPNHPLRRFYNWNEREAARLHWVDRTALLIRSVRVVTIEARVERHEPMFVRADVCTPEQPKRTKVLRDDVLANDPIFASAIGYQVRSIENALRQLEGLTSGREPPKNIAALRDALRDAIDDYKASLSDKAAE